MILSQYLILASEFVQHITVIVLVGFMVTECVACYANLVHSRAGLFDAEEEARFRKRKREHIRLLVAVFLAALWLIVEFFVSENPWHHLFFDIPAITAILVILWPLAMERGGVGKPAYRTGRRIFAVLFIAAIAYMSLDAFSFFGYHLSWDSIVRAILNTAQALALYFFVLTHTMTQHEIPNSK